MTKINVYIQDDDATHINLATNLFDYTMPEGTPVPRVGDIVGWRNFQTETRPTHHGGRVEQVDFITETLPYHDNPTRVVITVWARRI